MRRMIQMWLSSTFRTWNSRSCVLQPNWLPSVPMLCRLRTSGTLSPSQIDCALASATTTYSSLGAVPLNANLFRISFRSSYLSLSDCSCRSYRKRFGTGLFDISHSNINIFESEVLQKVSAINVENPFKQ